jgi:putative flippase GtrA
MAGPVVRGCGGREAGELGQHRHCDLDQGEDDQVGERKVGQVERHEQQITLPGAMRSGGAVLSRVRQPIARLWRLGLQYGRFGAVGAAATATHVTLFAGLIELVGLAPLVANLGAFGVAVLVSFVGHRHWTFRPAAERAASRSLCRFVVVALIGLALNSLTVYLTVDLLGLSYRYALVLMVSVVPLAVFTLSKLWAFA